MSTENVRKCITVVEMRTKRTVNQICEFSGYPRDYVYWIEKKLDEADGKKSFTREQQCHSRQSYLCRSDEFLAYLSETVSEDPGNSMSAFAKDMVNAMSIILNARHECLWFLSYRFRRQYFLTAKLKESRSAKAHFLVDELKHEELVVMLKVFLDEKNFIQDIKVNMQNDRFHCEYSKRFSLSYTVWENEGSSNLRCVNSNPNWPTEHEEPSYQIEVRPTCGSIFLVDGSSG